MSAKSYLITGGWKCSRRNEVMSQSPAKAPLVPDPGHLFFRDLQFSMAKRS